MTSPLPFEIDATGKGMLGMPPATFLRDYWQKKPLLIRNAFPAFESPLQPEDLAGLACEEGALARIVQHDRTRDAWQVENGPFPEEKFPDMPHQDWTLLVQDVDKWDADVAALLAYFDFLPRWRIDDIMISFAAPGGSVGAHIDRYDVFLLQGIGHRRWQIDTRANPDETWRDDVPLRLLKHFTPDQDWVLAPGDMLYLPPNAPHHGVAEDACLTLSVGLRAPSTGELLCDLAETLAEQLPETRRYADPDLTPDAASGVIDARVLGRLRQHLQALAEIEDDALADWFAGFITRYRSSGQIMPPPRRPSQTQIEKRLAAGAALYLHPMARCAWRAEGASAMLHIDGERFAAPSQLARLLCERRPLAASDHAALPPTGRQLVHELVQRGILVLPRR